MVLENLADDRRGRGRCPSRASSHRARAAAGGFPCGKPFAVVDHVDDDIAAFARDRDLDAPAAALVRRHGGDRLGGVLDDVGERLRHQPAIEPRRHRAVGDRRPRSRCRDGRPASGTRPGAPVGEVVVADHRLGHAREGGELVDHALDVVDLADDRVGALVEDLAVLGDDACRTCACRRSAESWIGVSGFLISCAMRRATSAQAERALGGDEVGDVVERQQYGRVDEAVPER